MNSKTLDAFTQFSLDLKNTLESKPEVIGLVFLGSSADLLRVDEWSDHDFFVVTREGEAEKLRQNLSWLPDFKDIIMSPRETEHGLKVVYRSGHVLEFAIFNDSELELSSANHFEVPLDRANIKARMSAIATLSKPKPIDSEAEFELFLATLLIGVGRARRGETLMAGQHIRSYCLNHAIGLIKVWVSAAPGTSDKSDSLNRFRRFEMQYPALGRDLVTLQSLEVENSAKGLLNLILKAGGAKISGKHLDQVAQVKILLGWA